MYIGIRYQELDTRKLGAKRPPSSQGGATLPPEADSFRLCAFSSLREKQPLSPLSEAAYKQSDLKPFSEATYKQSDLKPFSKGKHHVPFI